MRQRDPARCIKDALASSWGVSGHPLAHCAVTLEVADDYQPTEDRPTLLIADDGGGALIGGPWMQQRAAAGGMREPTRIEDLLRISLRLTAFALGRDEARRVVGEAVQFLLDYRGEILDAHLMPFIARIEGVPAILDAKDRETGAYLASVTLPVLVRP